MKIDIGKDIRRSNPNAIKLSETVQGMMCEWTEDNFSNYVETMKLIREGAPVQWVKLYMEAVKLGIEKNTNINININRQKDRDDLQALVRSRISLPENGNYTPYEEIKPIAKVPSVENDEEDEVLPLPLKRKEEEEL